MIEKSSQYPSTIRGIDNTYNSSSNSAISPLNIIEKEVLIDWFQVTIFPDDNDYEVGRYFYHEYFPLIDTIIPKIFDDLFQIKSPVLIRDLTAMNGYDISYSCKDIKIMINSRRPDMGVNVLLKGYGCRDFEELNIGWNKLFSRVSSYPSFNINRIDIAIDCFTDKYFTLDKIRKSISNGLCCSKFKSVFNVSTNAISTNDYLGDMIQFGSKASDLEITFYDKYLERINAGKEIRKKITFWTRTELRFRHEHAKEVFYLMLNDENSVSCIMSILYNYIDFKSSNSNDTNISRRPTVKWWERFISSCDKLRISIHTMDRKITRTYNWLLHYTSKSQFLVYVSKLKELNFDILSDDLVCEFFVKGSKDITDKDIQLINDYRSSKNMSLFSKEELLDYAHELKERFLEKKREGGVYANITEQKAYELSAYCDVEEW